jgi:hypothetical protein
MVIIRLLICTEVVNRTNVIIIFLMVTIIVLKHIVDIKKCGNKNIHVVKRKHVSCILLFELQTISSNFRE